MRLSSRQGRILRTILCAVLCVAPNFAAAQPETPPKADVQVADAPEASPPSDSTPATDGSSASDSVLPAGLFPSAAAPEPNSAPSSNAPPEGEDDSNAASELTGLGQVELLRRAEEVERQLAGYRKDLEIPQSVERLQSKLESEERTLSRGLEDARDQVRRASRWFVVSDLRFVYLDRLQKLRKEKEPFDRFVARTKGLPHQLEQLEDEWNHVVRSLAEVGAPKSTRERVKDLLRSIRVTRLKASRAEATMARVGGLFERMESSITDLIQLTREGAPTLITHFDFRPDQEPPPAESWSETKERISRTTSQNLEWIQYFIRSYRLRIAVHLLLLFALIWGMRRARSFYRDHPNGASHESSLVLRHPYASAGILASFISIPLYPSLPAAVGLILFSFAAVNTFFLLLDEPTKHGFRTVVGTVVVMSFLTLHLLFSELPRLERAALLGEAIAVILMCLAQIKSPPVGLSPRWSQAARLLAQFWIGCALLGVLAWMLGYLRSASILIDGSARLLLLSIAYRIFYDVFAGLIDLGSTSPWAENLNVFKSHRLVVVQRLQLLLRWAIVLLWARGALRTYTLYGVWKENLEAVLDYTIHVGALDFSVQSAFVVVIGLLLAIYSAKITRFLLTEEVMPRTGLRLGSQAAIASSIYYLALGSGLFAALAAAGIQLDRIAILVSALGVGIGFGLQNIVSNFISGVILMFERPVSVGDKIQLEEMFGVVEKIGFRASRVRTFDGAEVIVPNSELVADRVINWSLSDDRRRVEVPVGVKYGTDPEVVQALLLKVAQENPDILDLPAPEALFDEFGDNSLNFRLRGHTDTGSNWVVIRSNLNVAVNRELQAAGIEIPFPQRDLHLRSVDPEVSRTIGLRTAPDSARHEEK